MGAPVLDFASGDAEEVFSQINPLFGNPRLFYRYCSLVQAAILHHYELSPWEINRSRNKKAPRRFLSGRSNPASRQAAL